jgi:magnesium transporter
MRDIAIVLWKELRIGVLCGFALGLVNFMRVFIMNNQDWQLCLTITLSLFCTILMAKTIGSVLPILAKRLKIDPAIMSAPLLTTIVDALSLVIYFSFAKLIFGL